jgi:hypothetical protein
VIRGAAAEALLTRPAGLGGLLGAGGSVRTLVAGSRHGLVNRRGVLAFYGWLRILDGAALLRRTSRTC